MWNIDANYQNILVSIKQYQYINLIRLTFIVFPQIAKLIIIFLHYFPNLINFNTQFIWIERCITFKYQHKMNHDLFQLPEDILREIKCIRKINPTDKFPCFGCFDEREERIGCKVCQGRGYITGSHPMVQFSQDFIQKKIAYLRKQQQQSITNNSTYNYDNNISIQISLSPQTHPVPVSSCTNTSLTNSNFFELGIQSEEDESIVHQRFNCNQCGIQPIKGYRYHCEVCDDFDLCYKCHRKVLHEHDLSIFKQPQKQLRASTVSVTDKLKNIRKSLKKMD